MEWTLRADLIGAPTLDQMKSLAGQPGVFAVRFPDGGGPGYVLVGIEAVDYAAALAKAKRTLERLDSLQELIATEAVSPPHRVAVTAADAPADELDVIATKALAGLLKVSEQRVRELAGKDRAGFPKAHRIEGAAGMYFRRSEAEAYAPHHPGGAH